MSQNPESDIQDIVRSVLGRLTRLPACAAAPESPPAAQSPAPKPQAAPGRRVIAVGADHGGYDLKEILKSALHDQGFDVTDVGTHGKEPVDYPDIAHQVAGLVNSGMAWRGIIIDGAGIGSCMVANKVPGVRAGMAYDHASAVNSREHNDSNVLTLGAGLIGTNLARQLVQVWLATPFGGGRHQARVDKIVAVEKLYLKQRDS
jgi:ribose 5-phosphate isomerase B